MTESEIIVAIALGIGLSASAGFRVFIPLLAAGLAGRLGYLPLNEGFIWLTTWPVILSLGIAAIIEVAAYYLPWIDNLLDTIFTPLAIGAGTLITASVLPVENDGLRWITAFIAGGGISAIIQSGTVITRIFSSGGSGGLTNPIFSTGENAAAILLTALAFLIPIIVAVGAILLAGYAIRLLLKRRKKKFYQSTQTK
jgi:hypothetical protein